MYPGARLLVKEQVNGKVGRTRFEAIQRIYSAHSENQRAAVSFYRRRLGSAWRRRGVACLVSRSRLVVALAYPKRRRLGVLIDSRGAARCADLAAIIGDLLDVGYPDR